MNGEPSPIFKMLLERTGMSIEDIPSTSRLGKIFRAEGVRATDDLRRVLALPRRRWEQGVTGSPEEMVELLTEALRRPGGKQKLRPVQAACLTECHDFGGMFGMLRVGSGKCVVAGTEVFANGRRERVGDLVGKEFEVLTALGGELKYSAATAFASGRKPCVRVTLEDGSSTQLSVDHPIYTHRGWVMAAELTRLDLVARVSTGINWEWLKSVEPVGDHDVFDLNVPETSCFVGDNMLLHNTHITGLLSKVLQKKRPILFIPAKLWDKTLRDFEKMEEHWVLPVVRIETYEMLSLAKSAEMLEAYAPDLLMLDEVHNVKNRKGPRAKRITRYLNVHPDTVVAAFSGTMARKTLLDYWHIIFWCLGPKNIPVPNRFPEAEVWAKAMDISKDLLRMAVGELMQLCNEQERQEAAYGDEAELTAVRKAYQRRLTETPGVISTVDTQVACSLTISQRIVNVDHLAPYFAMVRKWETPDGKPFSEAIDLWRHCRELACGFYYRWKVRPPTKWLNARKNWCRFVRSTLASSRTYDTELQVVQAVRSGKVKQWFKDKDTNEVYPNVYDDWAAIRDTFQEETEAVWVDDTVLKFATQWMKDNVGVVWSEHKAFGLRLAEFSGFPYYGSKGKDANGKMIEEEKGSCIASIKANCEGRNLQYAYSTTLVPSVPSDGSKLEQLLGRFHRDGQEADEVCVELILACKEQLAGFYAAMEEAKWVEHTTGSSQKLLFADVTVMSKDKLYEMEGALWQ